MTAPLSVLTRLPGWAALLLCALAGALIPFSFAPFNLWPLGMAGLLAFVLLLHGRSGRSAWARAWAFGVGLYGVGVSWIYISIHTYGNASAPLAATMMGLFILFVAFVFSLPFYVYGRWFSRHRLGPLLAFPSLYLLGEWLRGWLLTGFPWLYLGYGHIDTWLAGWAPVLGVLGVSTVVLLTVGALGHGLLTASPRHWKPWLPLLVAAALWPTGLALQHAEWTEPVGKPISVGMVQPNIPQELKWDPSFVQPTLERLDTLSEGLWENDWLIWPEAAIPKVYHQMLPYLNKLNDRAEETNTGLITGIIFDDAQKRAYYNSIVGLGPALGIYHKRRLVPFGEYVPLEAQLRGLIDFFDLPTSIINQGPWDQRGLQVGSVGISALICYEVVYPDLVAHSARENQVLLTISNDAWFADSIGPLQHMQMARMRALETRRPMIRATNNGVSAFVDHHGHIEKRAEQFVQTNLEGVIQPRRGNTPFMVWGSWPVVVFCGLLLILLCLWRRRSV